MVTMNFLRSANFVISVVFMRKKLFKFSSAVQLDWWVSCLPIFMFSYIEADLGEETLV